MLNTQDTSIINNTFYKPSTYAVGVVDTVFSASTPLRNILDSNILLTYNPVYPMVHVEDRNDASNTLLTATTNQYVNVYKLNQTLVEILGSGATTQNYDKSTITNYDVGATIFGYFGYTSHDGDETLLLVNTGASSASMTYPVGWSANRSVDLQNINIESWPVDIPAYGSRIFLWNNATNIVRAPTISFSTSVWSINNGESVTLSWIINNATSSILSQPTALGWTITGSIANIGSWVYAPPVNNGHNIYTISATNSIGTTESTVDITTQNTPPLTTSFFMTGSEDALSVTGTLHAIELSGDTVNFEKFSNPNYGTLSVAEKNWLVIYTGTTNWCGTDTFTWRAFDQYIPPAFSDETQGTITILCTNDTPVSIDDTFSSTGGQLLTLDVTANDTDVDSPYETQTFSVAAVTMPKHGTLIANGATFDYTPDALYMGSDSFTYTVTDQSGATSNVGTVNISVAPGYNLPPVVSSGSVVGDEDAVISGTFSGSDINGDALTYTATTPAHGTVTISGPDFVYTPETNYNGVDSFQFTAHDGTISSNSANISITVNPIADAPIASDDSINIEMDSIAMIDVLANDSDPDHPYQPQTLTITGIIYPPSSGTASIIGNKIRYTPSVAHFIGNDSLSYQIVDQDGNISNTATVNISVTTSNQIPNADSMVFSGTEDIPLAGTLSGSDPEGVPVSFVLDQNVSHGTLTLSATGGFVYTPSMNYNGNDFFTYHVSDGIFHSSIQTVTITIDPVNDGPIANSDSATTIEDNPIDIYPLLNDTDVEGDVITLKSITQPIHGTTTQSWDTVIYTPSTNYCGSDTFQYIAQDQYGVQSAVGTIALSVTCVNDAPIATSITHTMIGNIASSSGNTSVHGFPASDIDGDTLSYTLGKSVENGTLVFSGNVFVYAPNIDFIGSDTFTFVASDGTLTSNTGTVTISVTSNTFNTPPIAIAWSFTTSEGTPLAGTLSGSDAEGNSLTYLLDQNVSHGQLSFGASGSFTYTPDTDFHGSDFFTYHVFDGRDSSAPVTISFTVTPVNDAPTTNADSVYTSENGSITFDPVANDTDVDGDSLILFATTQPTYGTATASGNSITYVPTPNWCGTDSMQYSVADPLAALSNTGTITLSVTCVNQSPVANPDTYTGTEDTPLIMNLITNDTDPDGDLLSIVNLKQPTMGGTVRVSGVSAIFTPEPNFCTTNPIQFSYQVRDPSGATSSATMVTISSIACINDVPTANTLNFSMIGNTVISSWVVLSGWTLSGYLATNNVLSGVLLGNDVDTGTILTYHSVRSPSHGVLTLNSNGTFTYVPTVGYFGSDSFTYTVSDGVVSSSLATVSIAMTDPNASNLSSMPVIGPGGSSFGAAGATATVGYVSPYTQVVSSASGTINQLTSQLYLGSPVLSWRSLSSAPSPLISRYESFLEPIKIAIDSAITDQVPSRERASEIRRSGQKLIHSLKKSLILSALEKKNALSTTQVELKTFNQRKLPEYEKRTLLLILRLLARAHQLISHDSISP